MIVAAKLSTLPVESVSLKVIIVSKALSAIGPSLFLCRIGSLNVSVIFSLNATPVSPCAGLNTTIGASTSATTKVTLESGIALFKESSRDDPMAT